MNEPKDQRYYWPDGNLKWGHPANVQHLILQLQTLDSEMAVSSVAFIDTKEGRKARAYGLSMSHERWDAGGWLDFQLPGPKCLAIWASQTDMVQGVSGPIAVDEGVALVIAERRRQVESEGWTPEHDDEHKEGQIAAAAAAYARVAAKQSQFGPLANSSSSMERVWPWSPRWWKPSENRIRNLVKAGALILAEIDRLRRIKTADSTVSEHS